MSRTLPQPITGSIVAIVTPLQADGSIDFPSFASLIEWHIAAKTAAIVVAGTTGESATLSHEEHRDLLKFAIDKGDGRIPIVAGCGSNSTTEAVSLTAFAKEAGANASLQVVPYYNRPTQKGLIAHFSTIADAVNLPLILYNVPGRTVADLSNDSVLELSQHPNIVGLKDATGNLARAIDLLCHLPSDFALYSGNDDSALALMLCGGHGTISVTANVAPQAMSAMCAAALAGDLAKARALNKRLMPLHLDLFVEPNPIPLKWALARMGKISPHLRLPLTPLSPSHHKALEDALRFAGCI